MRRVAWVKLAVAINAILATVSQAQTNSCISSTDGFWHEASLWSLAEPPSINQSAILITNAAPETVTIDSNTASSFSSTLTISNLTFSAPADSTNTLYLDNTGTLALDIVDGFTIGINVDNSVSGESVLISTNSTLIVDGLLGGQLQDNGTMIIAGGLLVTTNCSFQIAPQTHSFAPSVGLLLISNGVAQARDVAVGTASTSGSSGMIEVIGGTMSLSSSLTIGDSNGVGDGGFGNLVVSEGGVFVVTNDSTAVVRGTITVANASFFGEDIRLGDFKTDGELVINNGTVNLTGELDVAIDAVSSGGVFLNGGMLVVTNKATYLGDSPGIGRLTVSDGVFLGQALFLLESTLSIQGGTSILSSNLEIGFGANVYLAGGQLIVTNASMAIEEAQCIVSNGFLAANDIDLGANFSTGTLSVNGGSITASAGITIGDWMSDGTGYVSVDGGQVIVTNATGTGFIDVQNGQLVLGSGVVQVDKLVMTNAGSSLVHTGGTLIAGSVVLNPNAFQITSVARETNDLRITWMMGPGQINALQATVGNSSGGYTTNNFADIFVVTNNTIAGSLTNYLDIGAATNQPSRYYRARLAP